MADCRHQVMIAFMPYSDESAAVENAISSWLAQPTNLQYFQAGEQLKWSGTLTLMAQGKGKHDHPIRLVLSGALYLAGKLNA